MNIIRRLLALVLVLVLVLVVASGLALSVCVPAAAQSPPDARGRYLIPFAVHIDRAQKQAWPGYGIYLGDGYVLTAQHVAGSRFRGDPSVEIAGQHLPARFVKEGDFETVDLTLLRIDARALPASLGLRLMPVCKTAPIPNQRVIVAIPEGVAWSRILSPKVLPADVRGRFDTVIADVASTGNSGSGVFDAAHLCLMGIMSRKIQAISTRNDHGRPVRVMADLAKYFVPAAQIRAFVKPD
jgi:hypothetical protein